MPSLHAEIHLQQRIAQTPPHWVLWSIKYLDCHTSSALSRNTTCWSHSCPSSSNTFVKSTYSSYSNHFWKYLCHGPFPYRPRRTFCCSHCSTWSYVSGYYFRYRNSYLYSYSSPEYINCYPLYYVNESLSSCSPNSTSRLAPALTYESLSHYGWFISKIWPSTKTVPHYNRPLSKIQQISLSYLSYTTTCTCNGNSDDSTTHPTPSRIPTLTAFTTCWGLHKAFFNVWKRGGLFVAW